LNKEFLIISTGVTPAVQTSVCDAIIVLDLIDDVGFVNLFIITFFPSKDVTVVLSSILIPFCSYFLCANFANFSLKPGKILGSASITMTLISSFLIL